MSKAKESQALMHAASDYVRAYELVKLLESRAPYGPAKLWDELAQALKARHETGQAMVYAAHVLSGEKATDE